MRFIDEAKIYIKSGDGGRGITSFRREKFIEFGGPDGGNGGRGGNVIFRAVYDLNTLIGFRYKHHFKAQNGKHGSGANRTGRSGQNLIIDLPLWTQVYAEDGQTLLYDMQYHGQEVVIAYGGDGGFGNASFRSAVNRAPKKSTKGWPGRELWVWLKLKLLSDVGLLGLPNAGKSMFLSVVSAAKPKIAHYPFTTLKPSLGVVYVDHEEFVLADIPGLIEGASHGTGLGHKFLKHLERCRLLVHFIDITNPDLISSYRTIRNEIEQYSKLVAAKKEVVVLSKIDLLSPEMLKSKAVELSAYLKRDVFLCSSVTLTGINEMKKVLLRELCYQKMTSS